MATGQDLLDHMEDIYPELQLQSGEGDVAKGLRALNRAQDLFELFAAQRGEVLGDQTGTVTTTANTETTTFPSGVLRIDGLDFIDPSNSLPSYTLVPIKFRGGHRHNYRWPWRVWNVTGSTGRPSGYWTNGRNIYWNPLPDATHTVRWYGFQAASDITAGGTFAYPDAGILPFATVAARILRVGTDDPVDAYMQLAEESFNALLDTLERFKRDGPPEYTYRYHHDT